MKSKGLIIHAILLFSGLTVAGQKKFCADSSIRIKYFLNYTNANLFHLEDTLGTNIFVGPFSNSTLPTNGVTVFRTNWGDSIYWNKQFYIPNTIISLSDIEAAPSGTFICNGMWASSNSMLLARIDTNGNVLWTKRYRLTSQSGYFSGSSSQRNFKNILVTDNAIYITGNFSTRSVVARLDLDGNIVWSKSFDKIGSSPFTSHSPVVYNDTLLFISNITETVGSNSFYYPVISKLNANNGTLYSNFAYKTQPDQTIKGIFCDYSHIDLNNSLSITGKLLINIFNQVTQSNWTYNLILDNNLDQLYGVYYAFNPNLNLIGYDYTFDYNHFDENVFLFDVNFTDDKYFVEFNNNKNIRRTRKFSLPSNLNAQSSVNLDDKRNIHFTYNYKQAGSSIVEYARLSDFAPTNTINCFGIDTSILQPVPFVLTKEPYVWVNELSNILSSFNVILVEGPENITKQVVCKQVSYCDSIKILGPSRVCLTNPDVRYSIYRNPQCLKTIDWNIDTSFATVISTESDTAINLRFKKFGSFYLRAIVNNCVVNDSFLIVIPQPLIDVQLTKSDTVLCPGGTITLQVNPAYQSYQWQDGSNQPFYTVTMPGLYSVIATDSCGYTMRDSVKINADNSAIPFSQYYKICPNDSVKAVFPSQLTNITWQPSSNGLIRGNQVVLFPMQTTSYTILATSKFGCDIQKQVTVEIDQCPEWVLFPSAFTPTNDGLNDRFKPGVSGHLQSYVLKIYNRWGQVVFSSTNPYSGWDGTIQGIPQTGGLFIFVCYYNFVNKPQIMVKGSVVLIR
jgi:gliding motility-associated-like protein